MLPYFTGKEKGPPHDVLFWRWVAQAAVREGSWKFLTYGTRQYLFNIVSDPGEKNNLIKENPDIATRLLKRLQSWSEELQPAGLSTKSMPAWEVHYNYFLDHKPLPVGIDAQNKQNNETE